MTTDKLTLMASVGYGGNNRPDDVDRVKERLLTLGYPDIIRFRDDTNRTDHSGFLNGDRVGALVHQNFYWGTSWFADVVAKAGAHYRDRHLKEHPYAAPITLDDVSRPEGRGNYPPHRSHDTGLAVDLRLPRTDGLVRTSVTNRSYDSTATEAMIRAFLDTGEVAKLLFYDKGLIGRLKQDFTKVFFLLDASHDDHIHLQIKAQAVGASAGSALTLAGPVGLTLESRTDDIKNIRNRLHQLGFDWLAPIQDNAIKTPEDLQHAIDLFQAMVRGYGSPYEYVDENKNVLDPPRRRVDGRIRPSSADLQWLNAENAPRWQKIPAGTIDVFEYGINDPMRPLKDELRGEGAQFDDVVGAIRLFQVIINGLDAPADGPEKADGRIDPNRNTHHWLSAPNAPGWVKLQQPAGYELMQAGDVHTSTWLAGVLMSAVSPPGLGFKVPIAAVRASSCDIILPVMANGSLDVVAAQAIINRFTAVTEPATAQLRCHTSLMASLTGCKADDKVSDKHLRVRVQPPQRASQPVPGDRPPVVRLPLSNPQRPSLCLVPGLTAADGEPVLGLLLPSQPDGDDQGNLGIRLPLRAQPHQPITGDPGTPVQIKPGPAETLPYPTITPLTLPDLTFNLIPSVPVPQVLMAPTGGETPARAPGLRVNEANLSLKEDGTKAHLVIDLEAGVPELLRLWHWRYELDQPLDALTGLWYAGQRIVGDPEEVVDWAERCWLCAQFDVEVPLADLGLPLLLGPQATQKIVVRIGVSPEKQLDIELTGGITAPFAIDLGSPLARLDLDASGLRFSLSTFGGFSVTLPNQVTAGLHLDLFDRFGDGDAAPVVNNIWSHAQGQDPWLLNLSCAADLSSLGAHLDGPGLGNGVPQPAAPALAEADEADADTIEETEGTAPLELIWQDGSPLVDPGLLSVLVSAMADTIAGNDWVNQKRQLLGLAGDLPVLGNQMQAAFRPPEERAIQFDLAGRALLLRLGMGIDGSDGKTILAGEGEFRFVIDADETGMALMQPGALRMSRGDVILQTSTEQKYQLSELLSLRIPGGSRFRFSCDPKDPQLAWDADESRKNTDARITLSVPATGDGFTFEMESFRIHSAGIDLRGAVRSGAVDLGEEAGFAAPVGVKGVQRNDQQPADPKKPRPHQIGEIEIKNSRLIYGSLQASAKLPYFDDAVGTLTLFLSQGEDQSLACAGTLDISGIDEFHLDDLFITVQVDHLQLGVKYDGQWSSKASLTGRVKFQPPKGRSANEMGMLSSLFDGVVLDFEDLDPLRGEGAWKLTTPPKRFNIADILLVDLRGVSIGLEGEGKSRKVADCQLLGDITIQKLPGIDASLTFGGISLTPNGNKPKFTVKKIGAQFSAPGGFRMSGELHHISTPVETGFAGGFTLKIDALPELGGMLKLTRVTLENNTVAPSLALFVEREAEVELLYGFYLRRLGIGLGVRQALRGLEPDSPIPADQRLVKFVDNPAGLPDPIFVDSWRPVPRKKMSWMLVGAGLITFGNLPEDKAHLVAGSFLLSLDQDLRLLLGANLWLFTSPRETRDAEFMQRPVARGGIELSVRDGYLKAYLRTIKGPRLGKEAPPLLAEVLSKVETSLFYQVDRNGFIAEIGWPWETRIEYNLGDYFKGKLETGYRYGFYRGVLIYGLNFAMTVQLEASQTLSFGVRGASAEASLAVRGEADFRATFVGALDTSDMRGYLMGDVRLNALVSVRASASARIRISKWIKISISFSATLTVTITAALTAAMDSRPAIGFEGTAEVAISVCGYGISGSVAFSHNTGVISDVRSKLQELLQPDRDGQAGMAMPGAAGEGQEEDLKPLWHYRFHWLDPVEEGAAPRLRVLLTPTEGYPTPILFSVGRESVGQELIEKLNARQVPDALRAKFPADHLLAANASVKVEEGGSKWTIVDGDKKYLVRGDSQTLNVYLPPSDEEDRFGLKLKVRRDNFKGFAGYSEVIPSDADAPITWSEALQESVRVQGLVDEAIARAYLEGRKAEIENGSPEEESGELNGIKTALENIRQEMAEVPPEVTNAQKLGSLLSQSGWVTQLRGDDTHKVVDHRVDPNYDTRLARTSNPPDSQTPPPPLPAGLLLAELLSLLKDPSVIAGKDANVMRPAADWYRAAHLMKLVLEFEPPSDWRQRRDPVPDVIDLDSFTVIGQPARLESVLGRDAPPVEYDLIPGPAHQEADRVCLTWDFLREDEVQGARQGAGRDDFAPYAELDEYIVTRHNLSRPNDRPRVVATRPAWIVQREGTSVFYLRPPFQFIDDQLENVHEDHILQYRVEARATDRTLAATLINVVRKTDRPLPIVGQTLALHTVPKEEEKQALVFIVPAWREDHQNQAELTPADLAKQQAEQLKIQFRIVPAARFGAYGYDLRPTSPMRWVDGLPARRKVERFPQVKFAESNEGRPLPWEETQVLEGKRNEETGEPEWKPEWKPITVEHYDPDARKMVAEVLGCQCAVAQEKWPKPGHGQAVEFYIGRYKPSVGQEPAKRSPLMKCRHAVAVAEPESWLRHDDTQLLYTLDLSPGNTVDAFEELVNQRPNREFIDPTQMSLAVAYPETPESPPTPGEQTQEGQNPPAPEIVLSWRHHDRSETPEGGDPFNPVVGYRIHCLDRYDPAEYPLPEPDMLPERPLVTVRAIPERLYRATPESIVVEGVPIAAEEHERQIETLKKQIEALENAPDVELLKNLTEQKEDLERLLKDQREARVRLRDPQTINQEVQARLMDAKTGRYSANWVSVTMKALNPAAAASSLALIPSGDIASVVWEAGPIYLQQGLVNVLTALAGKLNAKCRLILHHPLEQRAIVDRTITSDDVDAERLTASLTALTDQLVSQLDARDDPFGWWLAEALGMSCECVLLDGDEVPIPAEAIRDHLAQNGTQAPCSVAFFRADDGRTLLNVFRVTADDRLEQTVKQALTSRLTGKTDAVDWPVGANPARIVERLELAGPPAALREFAHVVQASSTDGAKPTGAASIELPIAADGTLTYRWQAPDLWGHRYAVAIELVRRHDALWRRLRPESAETPAAQELTIGERHFKEIQVSRTKALVEHNLIVTPLPGSIQALVFRHPAAFAAAASAVNAVHSQYAGQTVILERRIAKRSKIMGFYNSEELGPNFWTAWQPGNENPESAISIWDTDSALPLKAVEGTEPGVYGADRYVYPDLPGYYQYRAAVYSSAGRRQSPLAVSGWVDPIYDEERQRPKASGAGMVQFLKDANVLILELPVVNSAQHLPLELRELWTKVDEHVMLKGRDAPVKFGDLPDLYLTYQVYLRTNSLDGPGVYVPFCRLVGPMAQPAEPQQDERLGFHSEFQIPVEPGNSEVRLKKENSPLSWSLVVTFSKESSPMLAGLNSDPQNAAAFIAVTVQRKGVWSAPVTAGDTNPFINAEAPHA